MRYTLLLALFALAGCSDRAAHDRIDPRITDESAALICLTYPTEPPCSYLAGTGAIVGTDIDLARRIAEKMGRRLVVEAVAFNDILPRLIRQLKEEQA